VLPFTRNLFLFPSNLFPDFIFYEVFQKLTDVPADWSDKKCVSTPDVTMGGSPFAVFAPFRAVDRHSGANPAFPGAPVVARPALPPPAGGPTGPENSGFSSSARAPSPPTAITLRRRSGAAQRPPIIGPRRQGSRPRGPPASDFKDSWKHFAEDRKHFTEEIARLMPRHFLHKKSVSVCPYKCFLLGVVTGGGHRKSTACHH
jgi:hypothetical protein